MVLAVAILLALFAYGSLFFATERLFGGLDFTSDRPTSDVVIKIIADRDLKQSNFYDLGSCRGQFACKIAKALPLVKVLGIDDSNPRTLFARTRSLFLKNIIFKKENIFVTDVSKADIVYLYLPQDLMPGLEAKLKKELKPNSLVISHRVSFPNWLPNQIFNKERIFVYKVA